MIKNLAVALLLGIVTIENVKARSAGPEEEAALMEQEYEEDVRGKKPKKPSAKADKGGESQIAKLVQTSEEKLKAGTKRADNSEDVEDLKVLIQAFNRAHAQDPNGRRTQKLEQELALAIEDHHEALRKAQKEMEKLRKSDSKRSSSRSRRRARAASESSGEEEEESLLSTLMNMVGVGLKPKKAKADPHSPKGLGIPELFKYLQDMKEAVKEEDKAKYRELYGVAAKHAKAYAKEPKGKEAKQLEALLDKKVEELKKINPKIPSLNTGKKKSKSADPFAVFHTDPFFTGGKKKDSKSASPAPAAKGAAKGATKGAKGGKSGKKEEKKGKAANGSKSASPSKSDDPFAVFKENPFFTGGAKSKDKKPATKDNKKAAPAAKKPDQKAAAAAKKPEQKANA